MEVLTTVTQNRDKYKNVPLSELSHNILSQDQLALSAPNHQNSQFTVKQTEKLNKTRKRRSYCKNGTKKLFRGKVFMTKNRLYIKSMIIKQVVNTDKDITKP